MNPWQVSVVDRRHSDDSEQAQATADFPALAAGASYTATINLKVSSWYNEQHDLQVEVNSNGAVAELDATNNVLQAA